MVYLKHNIYFQPVLHSLDFFNFPMAKEQGIILQTYPLRESDLVIRILTSESGRISAFARGARRSKKRFMGGLDLFDCGTFELREPSNKSQLFELIHLEDRCIWLGLRKNLLVFSLASLSLEVCQIFAQEGDVDSRGLYPVLYHYLSSLHHNVEDPYTLSVFFLLSLLEKSGVDVLQSNPSIDSSAIDWWQEMLKTNSVMTPPNNPLAKQSCKFLYNYLVELVGRPLKNTFPGEPEIGAREIAPL